MSEESYTGVKRTINCGCGKTRLLVFYNKDTRKLDCTYIEPSNSAVCPNTMNALSRTISLAIRKGATVDEIAKELESAGVCSKYAVARAEDPTGITKGSSCPVAMAHLLRELKDKGIII